MTLQTFCPAYGSGVTLSSGSTSTTSIVGGNSEQLCITSLNGVYCYVRVGMSDVVATTKDYLIPPNGQVTITKFLDHTHIAVISPTGSGSLHVMAGEGI